MKLISVFLQVYQFMFKVCVYIPLRFLTYFELQTFWESDEHYKLSSHVTCHSPRKMHVISQSKHTYILLFTILRALCIPAPPHKDSPVFRCRAPHTPPQVISTLIRDISGSHNALLTGSDCEWLHTNILFIYQPSYFYISSPLKHKWSIYLIWIGSQWIFVMTTKGTKKWVTKRQQLLLFLFFPTPLKPYLKVITPVFWTALDWTLFPPDYTKLILWNHC